MFNLKTEFDMNDKLELKNETPTFDNVLLPAGAVNLG
jgi:hypothetical protein